MNVFCAANICFFYKKMRELLYVLYKKMRELMAALYKNMSELQSEIGHISSAVYDGGY